MRPVARLWKIGIRRIGPRKSRWKMRRRSKKGTSSSPMPKDAIKDSAEDASDGKIDEDGWHSGVKNP